MRRRTASRCSLALPLGDDEDDEEAVAVAAVAMVTVEGGEGRG